MILIFRQDYGMKRVISGVIVLMIVIIYLCSNWSAQFSNEEYTRVYNNTPDVFRQYYGNEVVPFKYNETVSLLRNKYIDVYGIVLRPSRYSIFLNFTGSKLIWEDFLMEIEYYKNGDVYATQRYTLECVDPQYLNEICLDRVPYADSMRIKSLSYFTVSPERLVYRSDIYDCKKVFLNKYALIKVKRISSNHLKVHGLVKDGYNCTILVQNSKGNIIHTIDVQGVIREDNYTDFGIKYYSVIIRRN